MDASVVAGRVPDDCLPAGRVAGRRGDGAALSTLSGTYPQLNPPFPIDAPAECEHVTTSRRPTGVLPLTEGRPMRPPLLALTAALLTAGLLTGCSADDTAARQPPPTVTPTATLTGTPPVTP